MREFAFSGSTRHHRDDHTIGATREKTMNYTAAAHEPYAGKNLGSLDFVCSTEMVDNYCEGLAVDRDNYSAPTHWSEPVAPAMIVGEVDGGFGGARFDNAFGNLWMRQELSLIHI